MTLESVEKVCLELPRTVGEPPVVAGTVLPHKISRSFVAKGPITGVVELRILRLGDDP